MYQKDQKEESSTVVDSPAVVALDHHSNFKIFNEDDFSIRLDQVTENESIGGNGPDPKLRRPPRPNIKRGVPYFRVSSPLIYPSTSSDRPQTESPLSEKAKEECERNSTTPELRRPREDCNPETNTQRRLRHRELLSHLHCKQSPASSQDVQYDFDDLHEINLPHAQLVEQALRDILRRYPCMERTCYHPIMRRNLPDGPDPALAHSDSRSEWFFGSINTLMKKFELGELCIFPAVPIGLEKTDYPIPITPEIELQPLISPIILSPPSQPPTPCWTIKTGPPGPDPGSIHYESTISPTLVNNDIGNSITEASPIITTPRNRSRAQTIDSIDQVIKIKQNVEEWENRQVEVETEGIRAMKALQERYRLEGKPWITAVGSGNDPVKVWVDEWKLEPPLDHEGDIAGFE